MKKILGLITVILSCFNFYWDVGIFNWVTINITNHVEKHK